jgi:hypothetical protein
MILGFPKPDSRDVLQPTLKRRSTFARPSGSFLNLGSHSETPADRQMFGQSGRRISGVDALDLKHVA